MADASSELSLLFTHELKFHSNWYEIMYSLCYKYMYIYMYVTMNFSFNFWVKITLASLSRVSYS